MKSGPKFLFGLCVGAALGLGIWQAAMIGVGRLGDFGAGFLFNTWLFSLSWAACAWLVERRPRLGFTSWLLAAGLLFAAGLVFAHTWFFDVAIERRLTVLDMTWSGVGYFFTGALPARGLVSMLALLAWILGCACTFERLRLRSPAGRTLFVVAFAALLSTPLVLLPARIPSPLFDSAYELWEIAIRPKVAATARARPELLAALDKSDLARGSQPVTFNKVIVLVMETMTAANFARESEQLEDQTFLRRESAHFQRFERYFPNNQDSRTGMLDMLFSRLIPYEAYSEQGLEGYRGLAGVPSLVQRMQELAYRTAFAVSQTSSEEVVGELPWDETLRLDEVQIERARAAKQLCFTPDEWEQSCEDLALLPRVVDFVANNERAFVYQEFIWGHAAEYNDASGKSNTRYYSEYADALLRALSERGLADETLIALTSDHGFRDKSKQQDPEVYRVPLLFYAPRFERSVDQRLLSHVDLGALLFERISWQPSFVSRVPINPLVLIVGPTGQGHLFAVNEQGGHQLLREKLGLSLLIARAGRWEIEPEAVLATFRQYRAQFDRSVRASSDTR